MMDHGRRVLMLFLAVPWLAVFAGCERREAIARYTVEKPPVVEPTDRTLGAVVPVADQGWFFKLTGPKDAVAARSGQFEKFIESVRFTDPNKPAWTLPDGWEERPGSEIRYATLVIADEGKPLEVSVTRLPGGGGDADQEQYVLVNVNRWRNQLDLPPIDQEQLAASSRRVPLDGATATLVNLLGTATPGSMGRAPFMSGARDGN